MPQFRTRAIAVLALMTSMSAPPSGRAQAPAQSQAAWSIDAKVVPIQVTGDDASRFTLVVLADGYTAADMPRFRENLDKHLNILWSFEPFRSYRNYFNVYAVESVSPDSGLICDPAILEEGVADPAVREKLQHPHPIFGLNFGGGCTNVNARGVTVGQGLQQKVREYAMKATPNPDQILIIGNSKTYGGIGGGYATSTGGNALSPLITPHEIGHSLGRLTDEYTYSQRGRAGGTYNASRGEPNNVHTTIMTAEEMKAQQKKWWRWLGEPSEAGGVIGLYEGGSGNTKGIWRPSKHSIMISLGYYFDQVGREQMVKQISAKVGLIAASTPTDAVLSFGSFWINPAHPVYHELQITWRVGDRVVPNPDNLPYLPAAASLNLPDGDSKISVTVVDPTEFVRDSEVRNSVLTVTREWTLRRGPGTQSGLLFLPSQARVIGGSTQTQRPVGAKDVVYIEPRPLTAAEVFPLSQLTWRLDDTVVPDAANKLSFPLGARTLSPGTHKLSVTVGPETSARPADNTRTWTVDNTLPTVVATIAPSVALFGHPGIEPHHFERDEFTLKLEPKDDQPGYLVAEFRVDGDGWHHYYGWPDAPPGTPFKFTARGTNIKELIYGSLSSEGLSPQPWEPREPGWGTHRIEYRAKDAAGNIGEASAFRVTVEPSLACTTSIRGARTGDVAVTSGVTCFNGGTIEGNVTVASGASFVATGGRITGSLTATGAATIELVQTAVTRALRISGTTDRVTIFNASVGADATVSDNATAKAPLIIGSTIGGTLGCTGNTIAPENGGTPNTARATTGQCSGK